MSEPVSSLLHAQLASTFGAHLGTLCERTARALQTSGFTSLLVHAGSLLDDLPGRPHLPLRGPRAVQGVGAAAGCPGQLRVVRARDAPAPDPAPAAGLLVPESRRPRRITGSPHFDLRSAPDRAAARALLPHDLSGTAYIGDALPELAAWGVGAVNPAALMRRLDYVRAVKTPYELAVPARSQPPGRARTPRRRPRLPRRCLGVRNRARIPQGLRAARAGASLQPDHRAELRRCRAALPGAAEAPAAGALLAAHRRRCRVCRLRERHHAHLLGRGRRLRRPDRAPGPHAAGAVRAGARRGGLARHAPAGPPPDRRGACARRT